MFLSEKFQKRKGAEIECEYHTSMSLMPRKEDEEKRIHVWVKPFSFEDDRVFHIRMSRKEALALGRYLVSAGEKKLEGEEEKGIDNL